MSADRKTLRDWVLAFTDTFNRDDLEGTMAFFADEAVYDEWDGRRHEGRDAIRAALAPQFAGELGEIRFEEEDLFVDEVAQKGLVAWTCVIRKPGRTRTWRGLDVLVFRDDAIVEKRTYAKAERLALDARQGSGDGLDASRR